MLNKPANRNVKWVCLDYIKCLHFYHQFSKSNGNSENKVGQGTKMADHQAETQVVPTGDQ